MQEALTETENTPFQDIAYARSKKFIEKNTNKGDTDAAANEVKNPFTALPESEPK